MPTIICVRHAEGTDRGGIWQLYALNPTYIKPEAAVTTPGEVIHVGHLYNVSVGASVYDLMRRFGISKKSMMFSNVDLSRQKEEWWAKELPVGKMLCLVPYSCGSNL